MKYISNLFKHISKINKNKFYLLLGLTILSSIAEVISISSVIPFISIISQPDKIYENLVVIKVSSFLSIDKSYFNIISVSIFFICIAVFSGIFRLLLLKFSTNLGNLIGADLSNKVYLKTLHQPYLVNISRNSSEIIGGITQKVATVTSVLIAFVNSLTSSFLFSSILITLFLINFEIAFISISLFGFSYFIISRISRKQLHINSEIISREQTKVIMILQIGLGAIREIILDRTQSFFTNIYSKSNYKLQKANGENTFLSQAPRFILEVIGMITISGLVLLYNFQQRDLSLILPSLALLAFAAQRLLPIMQQMYGSWSVIKGSKQSIIDVINLLEQEININIAKSIEIKFNSNIEIVDLNFKYDEKNINYTLQNINLKIQKGEKVGIIGTTGSGKSTLVDILMCLLKPTNGKIFIDGIEILEENYNSWFNKIAHVPQNIFLADASIIENIAFGKSINEIDFNKANYAAKKANILNFILSNKDGFNQQVGERGSKLSGGQRQRIAIARALYKSAEVLILDEATSALDLDTENEILKSINELDKDLTIILITHRISTLKLCDSIYEIKNGNLNKIEK